MPPPIPVPIVSPTTWSVPRAAPRHHSPKMAQLASLSSVAGSPNACVSRSRSGKLVHPRLGVSSTTPVFVFNGPGDPMPTPAISLPRAAAIDARVSFTMRVNTASAPCSEKVGSDTRPNSSEPSSATVPATTFVPPISIPTTWRTGLLFRLKDGLHRERLQAQVMPQRAAGRAVRRARAARQAVDLDHAVPRSPRPEPEARHGGPEDSHRRRLDRLREVERSAVVRHEHRRPPDRLG